MNHKPYLTMYRTGQNEQSLNCTGVTGITTQYPLRGRNITHPIIDDFDIDEEHTFLLFS